jgi:phosphoribosylformylglycinamidine synthase
MPHRELLDPQGKTIHHNLGSINVHGVTDVRIGKHIHMELDAADEAAANQKVDMACKRLLANMIMESYEFTIKVAETV